MAYTPAQVSDLAMQLGQKGASPAEIESFVQANAPAPVSASGPSFASAPPMVQGSTGSFPQPNLPAPTIPQAIPAGINMAGTVAGALAGGAGGTMIEPGGGTAVGGALGAAYGNYAAQKLNEAYGFQQKVDKGQVAASAVMGAFPGAGAAGSLIGQAAKGAAVSTAAQVAQSAVDEGKLPTATQALLAAGFGAAGGAMSTVLDNGMGPNSAEVAAAKKLSATKDATLAEAKSSGYTVPPFETNPSATTNALGSLAGKAAIKQQAAIDNQAVTNQLAAKAVGLPTNQPITVQALQGVRQQAGQAYQAIGDLSPQASQDLASWKQANYDAKNWGKFYARSGDPAALKQAQTAGDIADALDTKLETHARAYDNWQQAGQPPNSADSDWAQAEADMAKNPAPNGLVQNLRQARKTIAKSYVVENALNEANGEVSAPAIGSLYAKGVPLTGELSTIGKFQQAFPRYSSEASKQPAPGVSGLSPIVSMAGAGMGALAGDGEHAALGGILGAAAAQGLPIARSGARSFLLSPTVQRGLLSGLSTPNYGTVLPSYGAQAARYATMSAPLQAQPNQYLNQQAVTP